MSKKPIIEQLRLGRRKIDSKRTKQTETQETFLRQAREFRAYGKILCIHGETFEERLNGAIAVGLAEVCEMLAEVAEKKKGVKP